MVANPQKAAREHFDLVVLAVEEADLVGHKVAAVAEERMGLRLVGKLDQEAETSQVEEDRRGPDILETRQAVLGSLEGVHHEGQGSSADDTDCTVVEES